VSGPNEEWVKANALASELEDARKLAGERARRLHAIEDLHERVHDGTCFPPWCGECSPESQDVLWPCATVRLARGEDV
jgi:hypothetical protein